MNAPVLKFMREWRTFLAAVFFCVVSRASSTEVWFTGNLHDSNLQPTVTAKADEKAYTMVFDTGANLLGLDAPSSFSNGSQEEIKTAGGGRINANVRITSKLVLGTGQMSEIKTASVDLTLFRTFLGIPCDGIYPAALLTESLISFDFDVGALKLCRNHPIANETAFANVVPFSSTGIFPSIEVEIEKTKLHLLLDTGYSGCIMLSKASADEFFRKKLIEITSATKSIDLSGLRSEIKEGRFSGGFLMGKKLKGTEFTIGKTEKIGMGWLVGFNFQIDMKNRLLAATQRKNARPPFPPEQTTGAVFRYTAHGLIVERLKPGGGAAQDCGLLPGDRLTSFAGSSLKDINGYDFADLVRLHANSSVPFTVVKKITGQESRSTIKLGPIVSLWGLSY